MRGVGVEENLPAEVRQQRTHEYLTERGFVRVRELSDRFGVSTVTARNDLDALEQQLVADVTAEIESLANLLGGCQEAVHLSEVDEADEVLVTSRTADAGEDRG